MENTHKAIVGIKYANHMNVVEAVGYQINSAHASVCVCAIENKSKKAKERKWKRQMSKLMFWFGT